ncbi:MAG: CvpA family protein [Verrucomicrobiota bacterium]|nr:CvpA family protein [Verrucomicrobiota bacterium]
MNSPLPEIPFAWQLLFLSFGAVVILLEMLRGWRIGLPRQLVRLVALLAAYAVAFFCGGLLLPIVRPFFKLPDPVLVALGGALFALIAYTIINVIGRALFKRTAQQESSTVRMMFGSTGALLGLFFGLFFVWLVFAGVRLVGSVAAAAEVKSRLALTSATMQPVWRQPIQIAGKRSPTESIALLETLAKMKTSLEDGRIGDAVKEIDPIPTETYRTLERVGEIASSADAAHRFLEFPGAQEISDHPRIVALRNDPRVIALAEQGKLIELMQNQRVIDALNDPTLRERIKQFDFRKALDASMKTE